MLSVFELLLCAWAGFSVLTLIRRLTHAHRLFGRGLVPASRRMLRIRRDSDAPVRRWLPAFASITGIACLVLLGRAPMERPVILAFIALLAQHVVLLAGEIVPPAALFLTSSSREAADLLVRINFALSPLRCVALLNPKHMHFLQRNAISDNLRTRDPYLWKGIVHLLIDLVPLVIIDARSGTTAAMEEVFIMLDPRRAGKALFIIGDDGGAPALRIHGIDPVEHALRCATENELVPLLHDWKHSAAWSWIPPSHDPEPAAETWEGLPSVLVVIVEDFDSDAVIRQAILSGKRLLHLMPPFSVLEEDVAQWALRYAWEFVHDRNLVLMHFQATGNTMIQVDFLRAVASRLRHYAAAGHRGEWTFEQLVSPDVLSQAVEEFVAELCRHANDAGLTIRIINR